MQFLYFDQHGSFRNAGFVRNPQDIDSRSVDLELHSNLRREQELAGFPAPPTKAVFFLQSRLC